MLAFIVLFVLSVTIFSCALLWKNRILNPTLLFILFSGVFSQGVIFNLNLMREDDYQHLFSIVLFFIAIFIHVLISHNYKREIYISRVWAAKTPVPDKQEKFISLVLALLICALIIFIYFQYLVGYNLFFLALSGGSEDFTSARLASYSGDTYTGAGVVNQFKNTIYPISYFALSFAIAAKYGKLALSIFLVLTIPFFLWSILGTGQRTHFFFCITSLLLFLFYTGKLQLKYLIPIISTFLILFTIFSVALGRTKDITLLDGFSELLSRVFLDNQIGTIEGFRYIYNIPIQYGTEWARVLFGYIPGVKGSDLSHKVFEYMYGTSRGTAPIALWASIYHNYGIIGVPFVTLLLLKLIELSRVMLIVVPKSNFWVMFLSFLFFYIGIIPATEPFQILNNGLFGLIFLYFVYGVHLDRRGLFFRLSPR
ncbi:MAG: oligosaccharide repeat unit polymerase [Nitrosomonas sp.]|nr:oligosaccharide repeat unit polymerase [Nitrosomonas sp.]MCC7136227.1 oligosaccharide repeat unit polymerase [Nitrosomonas sp.]